MTVHEFPHHYQISAEAKSEGDIILSSHGLPSLLSAPPAQFGGPGDRWSPEDLLVAAIADCFVLTFRAIASASKFSWQGLACTVEGKLDRVERVTQFTRFEINATLTLGPDVDAEKARRLLEKAESNCLISNALRASCHLTSEVVIQP